MEGIVPTTLNTLDEPPTMIVFTFSSTTDFAESLLAMSSKSTYYPKPISGSRLFVEATLVIRTIDSSDARLFFSPHPLEKCHTRIHDTSKKILRQFLRGNVL